MLQAGETLMHLIVFCSVFATNVSTGGDEAGATRSLFKAVCLNSPLILIALDLLLYKMMPATYYSTVCTFPLSRNKIMSLMSCTTIYLQQILPTV